MNGPPTLSKPDIPIGQNTSDRTDHYSRLEVILGRAVREIFLNIKTLDAGTRVFRPALNLRSPAGAENEYRRK
jgi:hypothetical protein